jgi:hypothetical protein
MASLRFAAVFTMSLVVKCNCQDVNMNGSTVEDSSYCPLPRLLLGVESVNQLEVPIFPTCDPSQQSGGTCTFEFEEGSVTYTGNSSGSIAFYRISDEYCLNSTSERKCTAGEWVEGIIIEAVATKDFPQTIHFVIIGIGTFFQLIGEVFDIVAACMFLLIKRDLKKGTV